MRENCIVKYEEMVNQDKQIKEGIKLVVDKIYEAKKPTKNFEDEILSKLMKSRNQGGFRYSGKVKGKINYVVIYTTGEDIYWQDEMDEELGIFTYYGDNKKPGQALHETKLHGNEILRDTFLLALEKDIDKRKNIPPFFIFSKYKGRDIRFLGLGVPGSEFISSKEWLTALWGLREEGGRFQNYKAIFTILDTSEGCERYKNDASIDLRWLEDLMDNHGFDSIYAPIVWKNWIKFKTYKPLIVTKKEKRIRTKQQQLPTLKKDKDLLNCIYNYFKDDSYLFEKFAIFIVKLTDKNIIECTNTRKTRDGGRDGIGYYRKMGELKENLLTEFSLEAKCYRENDSVGVKETSRLISRIKHREFGVLVTTSYVAKQAYEEIIQDNHPIIIISGSDIVHLLNKNGIFNQEKIIDLLEKEFEKN